MGLNHQLTTNYEVKNFYSEVKLMSIIFSFMNLSYY